MKVGYAFYEGCLDEYEERELPTEPIKFIEKNKTDYYSSEDFVNSCAETVAERDYEINRDDYDDGYGGYYKRIIVIFFEEKAYPVLVHTETIINYISNFGFTKEDI